MERKDYIYFAFLTIVFIIALSQTYNSFKPGYIASWDHLNHLTRAEHFYNSLNTNALGIFSWYPHLYFGTATFMFYMPGFYIVLSILKLLTVNLISMHLLLKILLAFTYAIFPITLYWLCRQLELTKKISLIASILSLTFSGIWGIGLSGLYGIGLYTNTFSLIPYMIFSGMLYRTLKEKGNPILVGLILGFIFITNLVTAVYSIITLMTYSLILKIVNKRLNLMHIAKIIIIALLTSLFWLYPFIISLKLSGSEAAFSSFTLADLAKNLFLGKIIYPKLIAIFLIIGLIFSFIEMYKKKAGSNIYIIISLFIITFIFSSDILTKTVIIWENSENFFLHLISRTVLYLLKTRILIFFWIIIPIISAIGIISFSEIIEKKFLIGIFKKLTVIIFITLLVFSFLEMIKIEKREVRTTLDPEYRDAFGIWQKAIFWLKENAHKNSIITNDVAWEKFEYPGTYSIDVLMAREIGTIASNGNHIQANRVNNWYINNININDTERNIKELHKFNIDYIISYRKPEYDVTYLDKVYQNKDIIIYKTKNIKGLYKIKKIDTGFNSYNLEIEAYNEMLVELPVQYNNHWKALVNKKPQKVNRGESGLIALKLEKGTNNIKLIFNKTTTEVIIFFISVITFVICIFILIKPKYF